MHSSRGALENKKFIIPYEVIRMIVPRCDSGNPQFFRLLSKSPSLTWTIGSRPSFSPPATFKGPSSWSAGADGLPISWRALKITREGQRGAATHCRKEAHLTSKQQICCLKIRLEWFLQAGNVKPSKGLCLYHDNVTSVLHHLNMDISAPSRNVAQNLQLGKREHLATLS